jgi:crotonobetainyl-CoA:carnitine CoA-transferase CaiB-like acyl-CoA transferase
MEDPRFSKEALRWENHVALREAIERFTKTKTKAELKELFGGKVPFSPIYNAAEIFADPHFSVREMLPQVEHPGSATPVCVPGIPVKLSGTPGQVRHRAPLLGEHSRAILTEVGLDATRIQALIDSGVVSAQ